MRPTGIWLRNRSIIFSGMVDSMSVATYPGVMQLTVSPGPSPTGCPARASMKTVSLANDFVSPNSPDLDAA
jgi:hypothetical protein